MPFLLDTNVWINYLKDPGHKIHHKLASLHPRDIITCSIVLSELLHGATKYGNPNRRVSIVRAVLAPFKSFAFDDVDAQHYAKIRNDLEIKGCMIGPYDLQIAAICVRHSFVLATSNVSEFSRVQGLQVEDW